MRRQRGHLRERERGLVWTTEKPTHGELRAEGFHVVDFGAMRSTIRASMATGTERTTLENPAADVLRVFDDHPRVAVIGVPCTTVADLRLLHGYLVEPAFRRDAMLLIHSDRDLDDLDAAEFTDPEWRYPWTLERLRFLARQTRRRRSQDDLPPMTPIEEILYRALRDRDLTPRPQFGIGPYRADLAFPEHRLVVECDGRAWHDAIRDHRRDAHMLQLGWHVLRFSGSEISRDSDRCVDSVIAAIEERRNRPVYSDIQPQPDPPSFWQRLVRFLRRLIGGVPVQADEWENPPLVSDAPLRPIRLDAHQTAAVRAGDGVIQVIAPAGSGKTSVLVERVKELLSRGFAANRILCTTFNRDAKCELEVRLAAEGVDGVVVRSFHGLGWWILKQEDQLRSKVDRVSYGQWRWLAKRAMDSHLDGVWIDPPEAQTALSTYKLLDMVRPERALALAKSKDAQTRTAATLYELYEEFLEGEQALDFDDLIASAVALLQADAIARRRWQDQFDHVLVDEYQDIEPAQALLVGILAAPEDSLFTVGDEDQCIYAWRRATVERVIEMDQTYPGLERFPLVRNYRCGATITVASRSLVGYNKRRFSKRIEPGVDHPGDIRLRPASDLESGAALVAQSVLGSQPGEVVVLARTTALIREVALACARGGVEFTAPEQVFKLSGPRRTLEAYLRLLSDPAGARTEDVEQAFRIPNRYLPQHAVERVATALCAGSSFLDAVSGIDVEPWREAKLAEAGILFDSLKQDQDAVHVIHRLRTDGGLDSYYSSQEQMSETERIGVETLDTAETTANGQTPAQCAATIATDAAALQAYASDDGIELTTIHRSKGREWPRVVLFGVDQGQLPHARSIAGDPEGAGQEDERRLAYVAMTRARHTLEIVYSNATPSTFLGEAGLLATELGNSDQSKPPGQGTLGVAPAIGAILAVAAMSDQLAAAAGSLA